MLHFHSSRVNAATLRASDERKLKMPMLDVDTIFPRRNLKNRVLLSFRLFGYH